MDQPAVQQRPSIRTAVPGAKLNRKAAEKDLSGFKNHRAKQGRLLGDTAQRFVVECDPVALQGLRNGVNAARGARTLAYVASQGIYGARKIPLYVDSANEAAATGNPGSDPGRGRRDAKTSSSSSPYPVPGTCA